MKWLVLLLADGVEILQDLIAPHSHSVTRTSLVLQRDEPKLISQHVALVMADEGQQNTSVRTAF